MVPKRASLVGRAFRPHPALYFLMLDAEQIQRTANTLADQFLNAFRFGIKCRHRWKDDGASLGRAAHQFDMTGMIRGFTDHQDQTTPFLERNVGGPDDQVFRITVGDTRLCLD